MTAVARWWEAAGLEVLCCGTLSWNTLLPHSLTALRTSAVQGEDTRQQLPQLCDVLWALPALKHLCIAIVPDLGEYLPAILAALRGCPLMHLALNFCDVEGLSADCDLSPALEVISLQGNRYLDLTQWLPHLAALPRCHSLDLQGCPLTESVAIQGGLDGAPALRFLRCNFQALPLLAEARAARGQPPIVLHGPEAEAAWDSYSTMFDTPAINYGEPCVLLPEPQLETCLSYHL